MARYNVAILAGAEADLFGIPFPIRRQVNQRILKLAEDPRPEGRESVGTGPDAVLPVHGCEVYYSIDDEARRVTIVAVLRADAG